MLHLASKSPRRRQLLQQIGMDFSVIDTGLVAKMLLLLLIGMGPKIALVPFLEMTHKFDAETKAKIGRQ